MTKQNYTTDVKGHVSGQVLLAANGVRLLHKGRVILHDVNIKVHRGEIVTLIGPNGSGKTSLIRVLLGLQKPEAGTIEKSPQVVVGYMPQKLAIDRVLPLTVRRFLRLQGQQSALRDVAQVEHMAESVGILPLMKSQVHDISGGEMQRVMLARALLRKPDVLVLDEPTQGLDVHGQAELYKLLLRIRDEKHCGILMVSHDLHMVMASTDRVICLNHHICCEGKPEEVSRDAQYMALFGKVQAEGLAVYTHRHDHTHDITGCVHGE